MDNFTDVPKVGISSGGIDSEMLKIHACGPIFKDGYLSLSYNSQRSIT